MLARGKRPAKEVLADFPTDAAFPAESFQIEKVVNKDWFAFLQEEAVAAEPAAQRHDHSFRTAFGNSNLGGDGEVFVQNVGSIAERNPGVLTRVGELRFAVDRLRRFDAGGFQDRRHNIDDMVELGPNSADVLDMPGP